MSEPTQNKVITSDSLEFLKQLKDYQADIMFADPPYALGSEVIIRQDGKVDYAKANDFMNKWEMPTGDYWEKWFIEAYRTLKHGGYKEPKTELAKKYEGYKYSVAPLKQTCETIMVFKKPNKTGSVLHDTLAMEKGDETITCSALNIDGNRVGTEIMKEGRATQGDSGVYGWNTTNKGKVNDDDKLNEYSGRYPAQTFIDSQVAEKLDLQSGVSVGGTIISNADVKRKGLKEDAPVFNSKNSGIDVNKGQGLSNYGDTGGCSKILHKCDYEELDFDLFIYEPKVSGGERNNGLYGMEEKQYSHDGREKPIENAYQRNNSVAQNNHPTLKPIDLNHKVLNLFKTPNDQVIIYPFAGSGSEIIGGLKANFQNWYACEINQDYADIANARIEHYKENEYIQLSLL